MSTDKTTPIGQATVMTKDDQMRHLVHNAKKARELCGDMVGAFLGSSPTVPVSARRAKHVEGLVALLRDFAEATDRQINDIKYEQTVIEPGKPPR